MLADEVSESTIVDNLAHTPDWVCEQQGDDGPAASGWDEPETIEVEIGEVL